MPAIVAVGMYFDKRRAMATGFVCSGSGAGTFLLAPLAQLLIDSIGWQGAIKVRSDYFSTPSQGRVRSVILKIGLA